MHTNNDNIENLYLDFRRLLVREELSIAEEEELLIVKSSASSVKVLPVDNVLFLPQSTVLTSFKHAVTAIKNSSLTNQE